jgi:NAD(P)-dependent dehydrogenase (short-subunit alcohol dehydrogenase family)
MILSGKIAVVTGGSRGIGYAVASALSRRGAQVMIAARTVSDIQAAADTISRQQDGRVIGATCDVRDEHSVRTLLERANTTFGGLDILVNSAGVGLLGPVETMPSEDWHATIDTNLTAVFHCCRYAIPVMKARAGGDIVNIASRSSVNAFAGGAAYCASKFGLLGFSEALNLEVRPSNIRVSCIMPGRTNTEFAGETPQDWHLTADDVAEAVIQVLSFDRRVLVSRMEMRPFNPLKG